MLIPCHKMVGILHNVLVDVSIGRYHTKAVEVEATSVSFEKGPLVDQGGTKVEEGIRCILLLCLQDTSRGNVHLSGTTMLYKMDEHMANSPL
jgi:hypothetical protein